MADDVPSYLQEQGLGAYAETLVEGDDGQRVRVITLPDFGTTRTLVLVNLRTLECRPVTFAGLDGDDGASPMEE